MCLLGTNKHGSHHCAGHTVTCQHPHHGLPSVYAFGKLLHIFLKFRVLLISKRQHLFLGKQFAFQLLVLAHFKVVPLLPALGQLHCIYILLVALGTIIVNPVYFSYLSWGKCGTRIAGGGYLLRQVLCEAKLRQQNHPKPNYFGVVFHGSGVFPLVSAAVR